MNHSLLRHRFIAVMLMLASCALGLKALDKEIDGYFRIQTLAGADNGTNFVEVRGPFTAQPDVAYADALGRAGTVFYIHAILEGEGDNAAYRLINLRSQGIDASMDIIRPENYVDIIDAAIASGGDPVYALVRQGFEHGYTSIARATVGTVFAVVASTLEGYDQQGGVDKEAFLNVARNFNEEVVANLDLGIRLKPMGDNTVQLFYDVPDLQAVTDWYLADDTEEHRQRKLLFERAMDALTYYFEQKDANFEIFLPQDVAMMESWGYDIKAKYPENQVIDETVTGGAEGSEIYYGAVVSNFRQIFADPDLLFNWLKLTGMKFMGVQPVPEGYFGKLPFGDMSEQINKHYLTSLLASYLPRLRTGSRVFLINGRVQNAAGNITSSGTNWVPANNTLGFASATEVAYAGNNGIWRIVPVDEETNYFSPAITHNLDNSAYASLYLDFPVTPANESTKCYTLGEEMTADLENGPVTYTELVELSGTIPAKTPFIVEATDNVAPKFIIEANDAAVQAEVATSMKGVLLTTALTADAMKNYWDIDYSDNSPIYCMDTANHGSRTHLAYSAATKSHLMANEAFFTPSAPLENNRILIGEPTDDPTSAINGIESEAPANSTLYDLNGRKVSQTVPGRIYILNGRKIMATR